MKLIEEHDGLAGQTAQMLSGFFRQTEFTNECYDRVMYPAFFAGILLSFVMVHKTRKNKGNFFLAISTLALALFPFQNRLKSLSQALTDSSVLVFLPISFILMIGPALYFYVRSYVRPGSPFLKKDLLHFLPAFAVFIIYSIFFLKSDIEKDIIYLSPEVVAMSNYEQTAAVLLLFCYLFFSFKLIKTGQCNAIQNAYLNPKKQAWLKRLIWVLTGLCLVWTCVLLINAFYFSFGVSHLTYYPLWTSVAILLYWLGFHCLFHPTLIFANGEPRTNGYTEELDENQVAVYKDTLLKLMMVEKPYLDSSLGLPDLAAMLKLKPKYLTIVLNRGFQKNFYDFLNEYRIDEAKNKLLDSGNDHLTLLAIAYDSGFNSKSSFNALFKKHVNMTPSQFKNSSRTEALL